jgi:GNAT superfamily N-acetyltransferase
MVGSLSIRAVDYARDRDSLRRMLTDRDAIRLDGVRQAVEAQHVFIQVAELSGEAVAIAVVHIYPRDDMGWEPDGNTLQYITGEHAYLEILEVRDDLRSRGVGHALLIAVDDIARQCGKAALWLHTSESNVGAHRFYEREGWLHVTTVYPAWSRSKPMRIYRKPITGSAVVVNPIGSERSHRSSHA